MPRANCIQFFTVQVMYFISFEDRNLSKHMASVMEFSKAEKVNSAHTTSLIKVIPDAKQLLPLCLLLKMALLISMKFLSCHMGGDPK